MNSPLTPKEMLSVRIPKEMNRKLDEHVKRIGVSKSGYILMLLARELGSDQAATIEREAG